MLLDTGAQCYIMNLDVFEGGAQGKGKKLGLSFNKSVEGFETEGLLFSQGSLEANGSLFCLPSFNLSITVPNIGSHLDFLRKSEISLSSGVPDYPQDSLQIQGILAVFEL